MMTLYFGKQLSSYLTKSLCHQYHVCVIYVNLSVCHFFGTTSTIITMRRTLTSYVRSPWALPVEVWRGATVTDAESAASFCAMHNKIGLLIAIVSVYKLDGAGLLLILCKCKHWDSAVQMCHAGLRFVSRTRFILANVFASASPDTLRHTSAMLNDKWERLTLLGHMVGMAVNWPVESMLLLQQKWPQLFHSRIEQMLGQAVVWGRADVVTAVDSLPAQQYNAVRYAIDRGDIYDSPVRAGFHEAVRAATRNCNAAAMVSLLLYACRSGSIEMAAALVAVRHGRDAVPIVLTQMTKTWRAWTGLVQMLVASIAADVAATVLNDELHLYITAANTTTHPLLRALLSRNSVSITAATLKWGKDPQPHPTFLSACKRCGASNKFLSTIEAVQWPTWIRADLRCVYPVMWPAMVREIATVTYMCFNLRRCLPPEIVAIIVAAL
jgi:hypothetical protein